MIYNDVQEWREGNPIKRLRQRLNMSQKDFADTLSVSKEVLYAWEKGRCLPNADNCQKLSDLGLIVKDIIDWKSHKPLDLT